MCYNVVCPLAEKDVNAYFAGMDFLRKYLDVKRFIVIGNKKVGALIEKFNDDQVEFEDENQFITYEKVYHIIQKRVGNNDECTKRTGWYLQQFLKFSYSLICKDEYYLLWDADTIPIHYHNMFDEDQPVFDMKTEHHEPYFVTFSRLFPNMNKRNNKSYISEHMIVKTEIMRELINEIGSSNVDGDTWHEKIINAIDIKDLPYSGFADYETYGLYCLNRYPNLYKERLWDSLRPASSFFRFDNMRDCDYEWILKDYDAISFEYGRKTKIIMNMICTNRFVQRHFSCKKLLRDLKQFTI